MTAREAADSIREAARKHLDGAMETHEKLFAMADEIDPPRPLKPIHARCDYCGRTTTDATELEQTCNDCMFVGTMQPYGASDPDHAFNEAIRNFVYGDDEAFGGLDLGIADGFVGRRA